MYWGQVWLLWSTEHVEFEPWIRIKHQRQQQNIQLQQQEQQIPEHKWPMLVATSLTMAHPDKPTNLSLGLNGLQLDATAAA